MAAKEYTANSYITGHLENLTLRLGEGGFWSLHLDTLITSVFLGLVMIVGFWLATRKATAGVPGKWQAFVEICLEFVDKQAKDAYHGRSRLVTPIAITLFFWILLLNGMKLIPADFVYQPIGALKSLLGIGGGETLSGGWKPVPTTDLNATLGLSISVFLLMLFFSLRAKGLLGFLKEYATAPFGPWLFPANILLNTVELLAKPVSLAMRLFGNMFGGEVVFLLIWVLGGSSLLGLLLGSAFGLGWLLFHLLVVPLQAFIFMMLSVVYLSLMEEHH